MAVRECPKCGEQVDEAKAYCPACGHAFVAEEQRGDASAYEKMDSTVQMGQTLYNSMLSDMGLNVKKPSESERKVEILKPAAAQTAQVLRPIGGSTPVADPSEEKKSNSRLWLVTIVIAALLLLLLVGAVAAVGLYLYFRA